MLEIKEDFWGDDGSEPVNELLANIYHEWERLFLLHDPDVLVNKYAEDCVHIYHKDGKTQVKVGREGRCNGYDSLVIRIVITEKKIGSLVFKRKLHLKPKFNEIKITVLKK